MKNLFADIINAIIKIWPILVMNISIIIILLLILLFGSCNTIKEESKLPPGYILLQDNVNLMYRIQDPSGYTSCQWTTKEVAIDYAILLSTANEKETNTNDVTNNE